MLVIVRCGLRLTRITRRGAAVPCLGAWDAPMGRYDNEGLDNCDEMRRETYMRRGHELTASCNSCTYVGYGCIYDEWK